MAAARVARPIDYRPDPPMTIRLACALLILAALPLGTANPSAAGPAQSYQYRQKAVRNACPPPLKFAAGACVRRCPAGYRDLGGTCRFLRMNR